MFVVGVCMYTIGNVYKKAMEKERVENLRRIDHTREAKTRRLSLRTAQGITT